MLSCRSLFVINVLLLRLFQRGMERYLGQLDHFSLLHKLPDHKRRRDERNIQVRRDKGLGAPVALCKDLEAGREQDDDAHAERPPRGVERPGIVPGQTGGGDALGAQRHAQADVVDEDGDPGDEDAGGGEADEPVKGSEGAARQAHEAEEHEDGVEGDAGVGHAPGRGAEEDGGRLLLEGEGVEHARARQQRLVGRGPGRRDEHGVDDGRDGGQVGGLRGNDKGALRDGAAAAAVEARVVAGDEHADDEDGEHVEEHDADKDVFAGRGDGLARVARLGARHCDGLDAGKGKDGRRHDAPVAEEFPPVARGNVLDEGAGLAPVLEVEGRGAGDAAEVDDEPEDDEEDDEQDLEQRKDEFDLAKDLHKAHADADGEDDEGDDPDGRVDLGPKLKEDANGCDFRRNRQ